MNISGSWAPEQGQKDQQAGINPKILSQFAKISASGQLGDISRQLPADQIMEHRHLMREHKDEWSKVAAPLSKNDIIHLIRFFTVAEIQLPGWEAGSRDHFSRD